MTLPPTPNADDVTVMGTYDEAEAEFMAKVDAWIACRQPVMANAATLKKLDAQEREAGFRLNNAAAVLGWHIRRHAHQSTGEVAKFAKIMRMACDNTRAIRGRSEVAVPTRYWHQLMDLASALAIKGGE